MSINVQNHAQPWSPAEDTKLATCYGDGEPVSKIATRLRRTIGACQARLSKLGIAAGNVGRKPGAAPVAWRAPKGMTKAQVGWARRTIKAHLAGKPVTDSDRAEATMILGFARERILRPDPEKGWVARASGCEVRS